jgi:hypothetical protein
VMGGVVIPYEEVVGIRVVESAHEFIVEHRSVAPDPFNLSSPTSNQLNTTPLNLTRTLPFPPAPTPPPPDPNHMHSLSSSQRSFVRHLRVHSSAELELWRGALHSKARLPKAATDSPGASSSLTDGPLGGGPALFLPSQSCAHEPKGGRLTQDFALAWLVRHEAEAMELERRREAEPPTYHLPNASGGRQGASESAEEAFKFLVFV